MREGTEEEAAAEAEEEEDGRGITSGLNNLTIETAGTQEEAAEGFAEALGVEVEEDMDPWAAYCALMACCLVALDKRPGVRPVGIGETLRRALAKLVRSAAGDQAKTVCVNLQLCARLEAGI